MEIDRRELKTQARQAMKQAVPAFWLTALVYLLLTYGVDTVQGTFAPLSLDGGLSLPGLFTTILVVLFVWVIQFGYKLWSLGCVRGGDTGLGVLFNGFSIVTSVIFMHAHILLITILWVVPASMAAAFLLMTVFPYTGMFGYLAAMAALVAYTLSVTLRFELAPYLLSDDPGSSAMTAVRRSAELMRGWRWELFKLQFSFLGWHLLGLALELAAMGVLAALGIVAIPALSASPDAMLAALTLTPLAMVVVSLVTLPLQLWLTPYQEVTTARFYLARIQEQTRTAPPV